MLFCWCRAGPGPQAATSGRKQEKVQDLYMELLRNLRFELPPPQISDTFDGENDGHFFWTTPCRNIIIIFCRGWPGTFQPPQKNTRTAVGLFSKNQSYLEMIHPPINWHSYGNPWVSSWKMLQMMFLFGIFGADRSGPSHISSRQGQMP